MPPTEAVPAGFEAVEFERFDIRADDGTGLAGYRWSPGGTPRAIVAIAHGMAEHAGRYDHFARHLADHGLLVEAHDHRGHGLTAASGAELGFFADRDGWSLVVADLRSRLEDMRRRFPRAPLVLFGHSMGSFMAQQILYEAPGLIDGAILSGSNGRPFRIAQLGRLIARFERWRLGARGRSKLLARLSFDPFNRRFAPNRTPFDWLSRDTAQVDAYVADPFCGFDCTTQFWIDLLDALPVLARQKNRDLVPETMPVLIFSGDEDPVGVNLTELVKGYRGNGMTAVDVRFYPGGRHEMLNETNRDEVCIDVRTWVDRMLSRIPA